CRFVRRRRKKLHAVARRLTPGCNREPVVIVDDRARLEAASFIPSRFKAVGQHPTPAVAMKADAPLAGPPPGAAGAAKRIRNQVGEIGFLAPQLPAGDRPALCPSTVHIEQEVGIKPRRAIRYAENVRPAHRDAARTRETLSHRANCRRRHHHIADPVRQEDRDIHHAARMRSIKFVVEWPWCSIARATRPPYDSPNCEPTTSSFE